MDVKFEKRCDELFELGLRFNGLGYVGRGEFRDFNVHHTEIVCEPDDKWDKMIAEFKEEKKRREAKV